MRIDFRGCTKHRESEAREMSEGAKGPVPSAWGAIDKEGVCLESVTATPISDSEIVDFRDYWETIESKVVVPLYTAPSIADHLETLGMMAAARHVRGLTDE